MKYDEALNYLRDLTTFGMNFGLDRIYKLLELLENPHEKLNVIHIGGTNGKGSTASMLNSILVKSGYKVGLFTSPHIHSYRERYKINNEMISEEEVASLITQIKPLLKKMVDEGYEHPTEFEVNTAMAFKYFNDKKVDLVILEVGLGGEIDSTNVVSKPLLSIITNVAMDHLDYLGDTLEKIATVKSGIIKKNRPLVTGVDKEEAYKVIEKKCKSLDAPIYKLGKDFNYQLIKLTEKDTLAHVHGLKKSYLNVRTSLLGEHQAKNMAIAVSAAEILQDLGYNKINENTIYEGLKDIKWQARFEVIDSDPIIVIDVAHNVDGVISLKNTIENIFPNRPLTLLIGMLADKEREKVIEIIAPMAEKIIVTKPLSPRAGNWEEIKEMAQKYCQTVDLSPDIEGAIKLALNKCDPKGIVVITGSFYMVSEARKILQENKF